MVSDQHSRSPIPSEPDGRSGDKVRHCYSQATHWREEAVCTSDLGLKADYFALEESWIQLAHSYELTEAMADFGDKLSRRVGHR